MKARSLGPASLVVTSAFALSACNPTGCFYPADLPKGAGIDLYSSDERYPAGPVELLIDDEGVPHIYGDTVVDLAYGLGYVHGRDRQFQLWSFRAALFGRLSEVLGEDALDQDRAARLITWAVDEQVANTDPYDFDVLESYAAGVNDAVASVGPTLEMSVLGIRWEPWAPRDTLAVARYFAWSLADGWEGELARVRIAQVLEEGDPRYAELLPDGWSGGRPVVFADEHSGEVGFQAPWQLDGSDDDERRPRPWITPPPSAQGATSTSPSSSSSFAGEKVEASAKTTARPPVPLHELRKRRLPFGLFNPFATRGASNAWAIHGDHTTTGRAAHSHDPHLAHLSPGIFYLVHFEGPDFTIAGGTAPGAPAVLLGHGRHVAWGTPAAPVDTMDTVRIFPGTAPGTYELDGEDVAFEEVEQVYRLGQGEGAESYTETWKATRFGVVLPPAYDDMYAEGEMYSLMWPGHLPIEGSGTLLGSMWDLGRAENVEEATEALQRLTAPAINVVMAFSDGTIAYRLAGDVPVRFSEEPVSWPRDGRSSRARFAGRLPAAYKPQLENPPSGIIVVANQKIVEEDGPAYEMFGPIGAPPWRALRIDEELRALMEAGKVDPEDVFAIQRDHLSAYARDVAPVYAQHCAAAEVGGDLAPLKDAFCDRLASFEGVYDVDSEGALPFEILDGRVRGYVLVTHLGEEVAGQAGWLLEQNYYRAVMRAADGEAPAIFDIPGSPDYDGLAGVVEHQLQDALLHLQEQGGDDPAGWRWGLHHYRQLTSELTAIPLLGPAFFAGPQTEEPGCGDCVRAEHGSSGHVYGGAVLRIHGDMTSPATVEVVNDTGQSGHFGHWSYDSAYERWSQHDPAVLAVSKEDVEARLSGRARLLPRNFVP